MGLWAFISRFLLSEHQDKCKESVSRGELIFLEKTYSKDSPFKFQNLDTKGFCVLPRIAYVCWVSVVCICSSWFDDTFSSLWVCSHFIDVCAEIISPSACSQVTGPWLKLNQLGSPSKGLNHESKLKDLKPGEVFDFRMEETGPQVLPPGLLIPVFPWISTFC